MTGFLWACAMGRHEVVSKILEKPEKINLGAVDSYGMNGFQIADKYMKVRVMRTLLENSEGQQLARNAYLKAIKRGREADAAFVEDIRHLRPDLVALWTKPSE